jgi:hypothetical protein
LYIGLEAGVGQDYLTWVIRIGCVYIGLKGDGMFKQELIAFGFYVFVLNSIGIEEVLLALIGYVLLFLDQNYYYIYLFFRIWCIFNLYHNSPKLIT